MTDLNQQEILALLRKYKLRYAEEGLHLVGLFGSYARGSQDQFSDIDVAYELDKKRFSQKYKDGFSKLLHIQDVQENLAKAFHHKVDLVSLNSSNKPFLEHIKKEMIYV